MPDSPNGCSRPSKSITRPKKSASTPLSSGTPRLRQANCEDHAERFATDFVLMTLKKRLFSSPAAFLRTLEQHESSLRTAKKRKGVSKPTRGILQRQIDRVDEEYSIDDEAEEATHEALDAASLLFREPSPEELALLKEMKAWAERAIVAARRQDQGADPLAQRAHPAGRQVVRASGSSSSPSTGPPRTGCKASSPPRGSPEATGC